MAGPMTAEFDLPIDDVLPEILKRLETARRLIIEAPPGAGKTTRTPLALMSQPWAAAGRILLLEPRRIAARAAAERLAASLGERVGERIGLRTRLDVRTSARARIEVLTEGVFTRMILSDPGLEGVSAVIFDEFHERSLEAEAGLAFALDAQSVLREDLRILVMSATLPPNLTPATFGAEVVSSAGRAYPVETLYVERDPRERIETDVALVIRRALREQEGSILAFLPGMAEIARTADALSDLTGPLDVVPLHGSLSPADQSAAIAPPSPGRRKVVLATDLAESALTIEGVRVVVDGGLARVPRHDVATGATRLETVRISVANADQRRGRAGRTAPGVCYRLWREAEMRGFAPAPSPEIDNADLTGLRLDAARWGARSVQDLKWLNPPRETPWRLAGERLTVAGALTPEGEPTPLGAKVSELALPPRLGLMVMRAREKGLGRLAGEIAALLSERDLGGRSSDLGERLNRFRRDTGDRARAMRDLARRWGGPQAAPETGDEAAGYVLGLGFPERIAMSRPGATGRFLLAGGRGGRLDETDPMARERWLVAADLTGSGAELRITLAARISEADALLAGGASQSEEAIYDPATMSVRARRIRRLGGIVLEETPLPQPPRRLVAGALLNAVREGGLSLLPEGEDLARLIARLAFLRATFGDPWPEDFLKTLTERLEDWLAPLLETTRSLRDIESPALAQAAMTLLDWPLARELDRLAPSLWTTPAGRRIAVDYAAEGGPRAECKVQEAFGPGEHPTVADGRVRLTLALLSPAMRPVALTRDLPGFWTGGYADMRKDMRGRYPKHDWPENPAAALPTSRAKPRS